MDPAQLLTSPLRGGAHLRRDPGPARWSRLMVAGGMVAGLLLLVTSVFAQPHASAWVDEPQNHAEAGSFEETAPADSHDDSSASFDGQTGVEKAARDLAADMDTGEVPHVNQQPAPGQGGDGGKGGTGGAPATDFSRFTDPKSRTRDGLTDGQQPDDQADEGDGELEITVSTDAASAGSGNGQQGASGNQAPITPTQEITGTGVGPGAGDILLDTAADRLAEWGDIVGPAVEARNQARMEELGEQVAQLGQGVVHDFDLEGAVEFIQSIPERHAATMQELSVQAPQLVDSVSQELHLQEVGEAWSAAFSDPAPPPEWSGLVTHPGAGAPPDAAWPVGAICAESFDLLGEPATYSLQGGWSIHPGPDGDELGAATIATGPMLGDHGLSGVDGALEPYVAERVDVSTSYDLGSDQITLTASGSLEVSSPMSGDVVTVPIDLLCRFLPGAKAVEVRTTTEGATGRGR